MLFLSAVPAFAALGFVDGKISRFGLSFYLLFSSLAIYAMGNPISAIVYLAGLGIVVTILIAHLEERWKPLSHDYMGTRFKTKLALMIIVLIVVFLMSGQLAYGVSLSIVSIGVLTIDGRKPLRTIVGLVAVEGAIFVILAEMGLFTTSIALLLSLIVIAGNLIFAYSSIRRKNLVEKSQ